MNQLTKLYKWYKSNSTVGSWNVSTTLIPVVAIIKFSYNKLKKKRKYEGPDKINKQNSNYED